MPRATGPIGYIEHRSPQQDANGKYIIHPQFVQKDVYDLDDMMSDSQGRCMVNHAQFISVENTMEDLILKPWLMAGVYDWGACLPFGRNSV